MFCLTTTEAKHLVYIPAFDTLIFEIDDKICVLETYIVLVLTYKCFYYHAHKNIKLTYKVFSL